MGHLVDFIKSTCCCCCSKKQGDQVALLEKNRNDPKPNIVSNSSIEFELKVMKDRMKTYDQELREKRRQEEEKPNAEIEASKRARKLIEEENAIFMKPSTSRRKKVEDIFQENRIVLFVLSHEDEKNTKIVQVLIKKQISFKIVSVDNNPEIRLSVKELSGIEEFPQLFVNGELKSVSEV